MIDEAVTGWAWMPYVSISLGSSGPTRVCTDEPDPEFRRRPVGFTADLSEPEPLLWKGDDA